MSTIAEHLAELEMLHANRTEGVSNAMVQSGYMFLIVHYEEMIQERDPVEMAKARETVEQRLREQHPAQADEHIENWRAFRPALRTAPTSAAGATNPNELTSSPEPAPASPTMSKSMLKRMAHAPAPSRASGLLPVAREGLTQAQLEEISRTLFSSADEGEWGPDTMDAIWVHGIVTPLARAIEAAHGIAPASGDAPGEAK